MKICLSLLVLGISLATAQNVPPPAGVIGTTGSTPASGMGILPMSRPGILPGSGPSGAAASSEPTSQVASAPASQPSGPSLTTVDGKIVYGKLLSVSDESAVFESAEGKATFAAADLWVIRLQGRGDLATRSGGSAVYFNALPNCVLWAGKVAIESGKLTCGSELLGQTQIDLKQLAAIYMPPKDQRLSTLQAKYRELGVNRGPTDMLVVDDKKGNLLPIGGVLKGVSDDKVTFLVANEDRTADLPQVRILELAALPDKPKPPRGYLLGVDGSVVPFATIKFAGGEELTITGEGLTCEKVSLKNVAEIRFASEKAVNLPDLKPAKVEQSGMFDLVFPYRVDRSSAGTPLRVGKVAYSSGLGLHSRCQLTYELDGKYAAFAALVGIDDVSAGKGNATVKILGDGKELESVDVTGTSGPANVRCALSGVNKFVILVDFGPDGIDVGDHVDLIDARLIKP